MGEFVCDGAQTSCTFGLAPADLKVTSQSDVLADGLPMATIVDFIPLVNIGTFGLFTSLADPDVAAATAAALGVLTPAPCVPSTLTPWTGGSPNVTLGGNPALLDDGTCACAFAGEISITSPGQAVVSGSG